MDSNRMVAGVGCSAGARGLTMAVLTSRLEVQSLRSLAVEAAAEELSAGGDICVAIAGPLRPHAASGGAERAGKGASARPAEAEIRGHKIPIRAAPETEADAPAAMRTMFSLARELTKRGFREGESERESPRFLMETNAAACAAVLLGRLPFGRATLEGRIQRQLLLVRERVALPDPMDSLEELTAHHLLSGRLPLRGILGPDELDALLAAFTAWRAFSRPETVAWFGRESEDCICLPVKELLEKYLKSDYFQ